MPGTREGGLNAAATNKERYGKGFYKRIGALGGLKSTGGGFRANPELASLSGKLGGLKSSRGAKNPTPMTEERMQMIKEVEQKIAQLKENARNDKAQR